MSIILFLFRINKGVLEIDNASAEKLNTYIPENERRIPFRNMIYIGDGLTDVPCMKLVKSYGGVSIAVYDETKNRKGAKELLENNRVDYIAAADYCKNSDLDEIVHSTMKKIKAVDELERLKGKY